MKAEAGWGAAALVAVAAFVGVTSQPGGKGSLSQSAPLGPHSTQRSQVEGKSPFERGPCVDLESKIRTLLLVSPESVAAPESCYDGSTPSERIRNAAADDAGAGELRDRAATLRYWIAIVPDPLHTHFSLSFDRSTEAIQQGAQDEGYLYDSSWMPWETEKPSLVLLHDEDTADDRTEAREEQPGVILFRRRALPGEMQTPSGGPYPDGLVVFIVGEEPTSGIHKRQFENAARWIDALQPKQDGVPAPPWNAVKILGPTFSGSLPSLSQALRQQELAPTLERLAARAPYNLLPVYSGGITSASAARWFVESAKSAPGVVRFRSFQESDARLLDNYREYLKDQGFKISHLAIVSEDETAFGGFDEKDRETLCAPDKAENVGPVCVFYPRDISVLRGAYQKQSIFNPSTGQQPGGGGQRTLSTDLADPENEDHDTVRNYSGDKTALSQEAVLQQIVSVLSAHESEYVVLRSSNPLDQLFLSHFLRLAYPQGRVVLEGSDLLLRRESGAATLSGIMTLSSYPLLPWQAHWIVNPYLQNRHAHRVFAQDIAEGTYVATRFLLHSSDAEAGCPDSLDRGYDGGEANGQIDLFLPPSCGDLRIPDYAPPFWAMPAALGPDAADAFRPATWLSVLGRGGFWPVAALNAETLISVKGHTDQPSANDSSFSRTGRWIKRQISKAGQSVVSLMRHSVRVFAFWEDGSSEVSRATLWPPMPLSMKVCLLLMVLGTFFHLSCCAFPSLMAKPGHRAYFARVPQGHHLALVVMGSVFVAMLPVFMGWGYGAMSAGGEPVPHPWLYRILLPILWLLAGGAVGANAWIQLPPGVEGAWQAKCRGIASAIGAYAIATSLFYCLVDFSFGESLDDANSIPTYWRSIHLGNGVSPLVPLIALAAGLYLWFWNSIQGLALFNMDGPLLPTRFQLAIDAKGGKLSTLRMFSREEAAIPLEGMCRPFAKEFWVAAAIVFPVLLLIGAAVARDVPFRSLGSKDYSRFFAISMAICAALMLANSWQLLRIWLKLRQLLVFLDRLHLRRTMDALKGYSWGSVWRMGGRVLDVRYKLLSRQMEALTHLDNSLKESLMECNARDVIGWWTVIRETQSSRARFADWFSSNWNNWKERDLSDFYSVQRSIAHTSGIILAGALVPHWRSEDQSLVQKAPGNSGSDGGDAGKGESRNPTTTDVPNYIRNAEELVCLVYLGFIQNILGRMRTIVMQIGCLFVAAAIAVASYPFDPRSEVSAAMIVLFLMLGTVVVTVYSQMHRDSTLSLVTDTKPGELGPDFWFKLIGFGAGPVLGLLATIFPELPGSLFSWLQPGLDSIR